MDPTARFTDRVADYVKYRPGYPEAAIDAIVRVTGLKKGATIADIGSGTGISARPFVERGYDVVGVEPNAAMRAAAEACGAKRSQPSEWGARGAQPLEQDRFRSVDGTAEKTGLPDASVDLAIAAQAFHWFRSDEARSEMKRVIRPPHWMALIWNERLTDTPFLQAYEAALREHAIDYETVDHRNIDLDAIARFFGGPFETLAFDNVQRFDRAGFIGRALSSSYVPQKGHPKHEGMMRALERIFDEHVQLDGSVDFRYLTSVHVGRLS